MRLVIQSRTTGCFLAPNVEDGQPEWVMLLSEAATLDDVETCVQLIEDHAEPFHRPAVVDLDDLYGKSLHA
ncbi:hypothetical protein KW843_02815 [Acidovorax sp. sif1233]|jgi:hypothetical protein|uniref:hypothetical protein n=1 Tax=unclassified Acidovorax TaxID=2684926 RepID=UPI001C47AC11|nr:hypothetical protein [Acidovorax sp. sif1233]MBV7453394.1 hypothetical protein [Acidovorax sp. sif1233]